MAFWFDELGQEKWFGPPSEELDRLITDRLGPLYDQAVAGELQSWRQSPQGAVALCLLLDQAPRNMFRGSPRAFATDAAALEVARQTVDQGLHLSADLDDFARIFLYMPFEHSENLNDQKDCVALMAALENDDEDWAKYAQEHLDLIERFGRFPHRNRVLGRPCTQAERIFLREGESGFGQGGPGAIFGLDHILIATADLDGAAAKWAALGFTVTERGFHEGWATANHCIMFGDHYIEIIGRQGPGTAPPGFDDSLSAGRPLCGIAFAAPDGAEAADCLNNKGVATEPVADLSRQAPPPFSDQRVSFELVRPRETGVFGLPSFVCVHKTRDLVWQPALLEHANSATEVTAFSAPVDSIDDAVIERYRALIGENCAAPTSDGTQVDLWGIGMQLGPAIPALIEFRIDADSDPADHIRRAGLEPAAIEGGAETQLDGITLRFIAR